MFVVLSLIVALGVVVAAWQIGRRRGIASLGSPEWVVLQARAPRHLANDEAIIAYSHRVQAWRWFGVMGGAIGWVSWLAFAPNQRSANLTVALFIGWFAAGIIPELFVRHRSPAARRVASLEPRRPLRFVTPTARRWWIASVTTTAAALLLGLARSVGDSDYADRRVTTLCWLAVLTVVATAAVVRITTRPQPAGTDDDVVVDNTIRQAATTRAVAGWIVLQFTAAGYLVPPMPPGAWSNVATLQLYLAGLGALAGWAWVPTRIWGRQTS